MKSFHRYPLRVRAAFLAAVLCLVTVEPGDLVRAEGLEKRILGTVTGVLEQESKTQVFVSDRENVPSTVNVTQDTEIKQQIDLDEILVGEFAGVIYEEQEGARVALSTSVGAEEKVHLAQEELLKFAPQPEMPAAPEVPEAPEMPPIPDMGAQGGPQPGAGGPEGSGVEKGKEATGFSAEDAAKAKAKDKKKHPLDDVLSEEGPLSEPGGVMPPSFVTGKILSLDVKPESQTMVLKDSEGKEVTLVMGPQPQIVNRYLEPSGLAEGHEVEIVFEEKGEDKIAHSILIGKPATKLRRVRPDGSAA